MHDLKQPRVFYQDAVCHIFSELKLRGVFLPVYFVDTNLPEKKVQILLSEKELKLNLGVEYFYPLVSFPLLTQK